MATYTYGAGNLSATIVESYQTEDTESDVLIYEVPANKYVELMRVELNSVGAGNGSILTEARIRHLQSNDLRTQFLFRLGAVPPSAWDATGNLPPTEEEETLGYFTKPSFNMRTTGIASVEETINTYILKPNTTGPLFFPGDEFRFWSQESSIGSYQNRPLSVRLYFNVYDYPNA